MPPEAKVSRREASNIDHGGTEASVKVSVVRAASEGKEGKARDSQSAMSRSKYGSGLGHFRDGQQSQRDLPYKQHSNKKRDELVSSIVQSYGAAMKGEKHASSFDA